MGIPKIQALVLCIATFLIPQIGWSQQPKFSWEFEQAVHTGDIDAAKKILTQNPEWVSQYRFGLNPPLVEAAERGKFDIVELLTTNHADINAHGVWGYTALHFAARNGDAKIVQLLLNHGADVNAQDENHFTPMILASKNVEVIKLLLACGADINAHGYVNTIFSQAVGDPRNVDLAVIQFILTNGINVAISEANGLGQVVTFSDNTNLAKMLVPYYANATNPAANLLLQEALGGTMYDSHIAMAKTLVAALINLETNPLHQAVARGDDATVRAILATNSASVNNREFFGWTPLHIAAITGKTTTASILLENQSEVDAQDNISNTPLHWAAFWGHDDMVKILLSHKANMDIPGNTLLLSSFGHNDTPLDLAIQQDFTSIAVRLITNNTSSVRHDISLDAPLRLATSKGNLELMRLLLTRGANANALDIAVQGNSPELVKLLMAGGADPQANVRTQSGGITTLFHLWADGSGNTNIAGQLLAAGCDPNATNSDGQAPLHVAVQKWNFFLLPDPTRTNSHPLPPGGFIVKDINQDAALWLLSHKAGVNAKDKNGQTPLHLVVTQGKMQAIKYLLDYKANINATDNNGKTPLALLEDFKIKESQSLQGMRVDFKAIENLLSEHGAKGPLLTPKPTAGPVNIF